jgi:hypothetical protein
VTAAVAGDTVLVAAGTYSWTQQGTGTEYALVRVVRDQTGFAIIGEGGPEVTILDGERLGRLFFISGYNEILIQGFTFTRGRAHPGNTNVGGALVGHLSSPTIRDCVFVDNTADEEEDPPGDYPYGAGGAIWYGGVSNLVVEDCVFRENRAQIAGAVMLINSSGNSVFRRCSFVGNEAVRRGGAICVANFKFELEECLIAENTAESWAGGLYILALTAATHPSRVHRCTLVGNSGSSGGGILLRQAELTVTSTIIADSPRGGALRIEESGQFTVGCCDLYGNSGGSGNALPTGTIDLGGNFSSNPLFCEDLGLRPYGLLPASPCADGNHPGGIDCGQIGALPPSCGVQEQRSWGHTKSLFR